MLQTNPKHGLCCGPLIWNPDRMPHVYQIPEPHKRAGSNKGKANLAGRFEPIRGYSGVCWLLLAVVSVRRILHAPSLN